MNIDEMLRDACAELRTATDNRPLPSPRFAAPAMRKRRVWQVALAAVIALSVATLVVRAVDRDGKPKQIDTVVPSSTTAPTDDEAALRFAPPPANLPNYVGFPLSDVPEVLERWGVDVELVVEPGVRDPSRGRIIDQRPAGGTPLTAGMTVSFTVGQPTAILDGEFEIGSGTSGKQGAWRVIASTKVSFGESLSGGYANVVVAEKSGGISTAHFDEKALVQYDHAFQFGLVFGTAPASATSVQMLDFQGNFVSSVPTKRSSDPYFADVSFWLIETANHPFYTSLRAIDFEGNVVAQLPGR